MMYAVNQRSNWSRRRASPLRMEIINRNNHAYQTNAPAVCPRRGGNGAHPPRTREKQDSVWKGAAPIFALNRYH